jgi:hypothetical protein
VFKKHPIKKKKEKRKKKKEKNFGTNVEKPRNKK